MIVFGDEQSSNRERFLIKFLKNYKNVFDHIILPTLISSSIRERVRALPHSIVKIISNSTQRKVIFPLFVFDNEKYVDLFKKLHQKRYNGFFIPSISAIRFAEWFDLVELLHELEADFLQLNVIVPSILNNAHTVMRNFFDFLPELRQLTGIPFLIKLPFQALFIEKLPQKLFPKVSLIFACYSSELQSNKDKTIIYKLTPLQTNFILDLIGKFGTEEIGLSLDVQNAKQIAYLFKKGIRILCVPYFSKNIISTLRQAKENLDKYELHPMSFSYSVSHGGELKLIIDHSKCDKCEGQLICINYCPFNAIIIKKGYPFIDNIRCIRCYQCINICPKEAILREYRVDIETTNEA